MTSPSRPMALGVMPQRPATKTDTVDVSPRPPIARGVLRHRGRPSKRSATVVTAILENLSRGRPRCLAAKSAGISRSTFYRWLRQDQNLRNEVLRIEQLHAPNRSFYRWEHHPFRGFRPPRPAHLRGAPYPAPRFR